MANSILIASLCAELTPVKRNDFESDMAIAGLIGGGVSLAALLSTLGIQSGPAIASNLVPLAIKTGFAVSLATVGFAALLKLSRPGVSGTNLLQKAAAIAILLASIMLVQSGHVNNAGDAKLLLGASWQSCSLRIATFSIPIAAMLGWAVRRQAPVRLRQAGAAIGLTSGAAAAAIYALACAENSSAFIAIWYTAGIAISTSIGASLGPRLLRW